MSTSDGRICCYDDCGHINQHNARFCARCGRVLRYGTRIDSRKREWAAAGVVFSFLLTVFFTVLTMSGHPTLFCMIVPCCVVSWMLFFCAVYHRATV